MPPRFQPSIFSESAPETGVVTSTDAAVESLLTDVPDVQLPDVIEALKAERVPVWSDAYGHTSFLWNKRQMNLRGIGA